MQIKWNQEAAPYLRDVLLTFGDGVLDLGALADDVVVVEALLLLDEVVSRRHQPIGLPRQRPPEAAARAVPQLVARVAVPHYAGDKAVSLIR
jgi:hypothetical protein